MRTRKQEITVTEILEMMSLLHTVTNDTFSARCVRYRTNSHAIAKMFVRPSVCMSVYLEPWNGPCIVIIRCTLGQM